MAETTTPKTYQNVGNQDQSGGYYQVTLATRLLMPERGARTRAAYLEKLISDYLPTRAFLSQ